MADRPSVLTFATVQILRNMLFKPGAVQLLPNDRRECNSTLLTERARHAHACNALVHIGRDAQWQPLALLFPRESPIPFCRSLTA